MNAPALPEELIARFRSVAQERLLHIEEAWSAVTRDSSDVERAATLSRELHTLKGESRAVGFADVNLVCHKLEEMLERARGVEFRVSDNFDLVVISAIQFIAMLLRKRPGQAFGGIDLPGFLRQIDEAIRETQGPEPSSASGSMRALSRPRFEAEVDRVTPETCRALAIAATRIYCEKLAASGGRQDRLLDLWRDLATLIMRLSSTPLTQLAARHAKSALELARGLQRRVSIDLDSAELRVGSGIVEPIELALLHGLRNAVDHGIEPERVRVALGKPRTGRIRIVARLQRPGVVLRIEDDGRGLDPERIRSRAVELGVWTSDVAAAALPAQLFDLVFEPGFSTQAVPSEISGRGVGLDAVRAAACATGGEVSLTSELGRGSALEVRLPDVGWTIGVNVVSVPGQMLLALPESCRLSFEPSNAMHIELATLLGVDSGHSLPPDAGGRELSVRTDRVAFKLSVLSAPSRANAERRCPTGADDPVEIVAIDGAEAVLVRPQAVFRMAERFGIAL